MEGTANIGRVRVNVAFPHALLSSSMKLAMKLEPLWVALESLPQDLQDHIAGHTTTMLNLFNETKQKSIWNLQIR